MLYKNVEIHNIGEIVQGENSNSIRWYRVPSNVYEKLETMQGRTMCRNSTGVELRFVMKSDTVILRMRSIEGSGVFHVYRGSIQGGYEDHEDNKIVNNEFSDFVIKKSENMQVLNRITKDFYYPFSPEVVRVIFDRGSFELSDIIGDVEPPKKAQLPNRTIFAYGSSITHGSNSIDASHSWLSVLAHNLGMDCRNLGMAGSCKMEPEIIDYIADEGVKGKWDIAILELGINALDWEVEKISNRVENTLKQIAGKNQKKPIFTISPLYSIDDYNGNGNADKWRGIIKSTIEDLGYSNVYYIDGRDLIGDMSLISADEVHPNIYGIMQISQKLVYEMGRKLR